MASWVIAAARPPGAVTLVDPWSRPPKIVAPGVVAPGVVAPGAVALVALESSRNRHPQVFAPRSCRPDCPPELWPYSRRPGVVPGSRPPQDNNNSGRQLRVAAWGNSDLTIVVQGNNNSKRQQPGATAQDNNLGQRLGATATRRQQLSNSSSERQQLEATALGDSLGRQLAAMACGNSDSATVTQQQQLRATAARSDSSSRQRLWATAGGDSLRRQRPGDSNTWQQQVEARFRTCGPVIDDSCWVSL